MDHLAAGGQLHAGWTIHFSGVDGGDPDPANLKPTIHN